MRRTEGGLMNEEGRIGTRGGGRGDRGEGKEE
jgi:hypothetical protein